jgi:hypothetical protein
MARYQFIGYHYRQQDIGNNMIGAQEAEDPTLKEHQSLVQMISEEASILEHRPSSRRALLLGFLVELQIIKSKEL